MRRTTTMAPFFLIYAVSFAQGGAHQQAEKKSDPRKYAAMTTADVDEDFAFQGEYTGIVDSDDGPTRLGVQVIAQGAGKFAAVAYPGGLPGDGWDRHSKIAAEGEIAMEKDSRSATWKRAQQNLLRLFPAGNPLIEPPPGKVVKLTGPERTGIISRGKLYVKNTQGRQIGVLKKVLRKSPTLSKKPPLGAVVLFDGTSPDNFQGGRMTEDGLLMEGITSKQRFQSFTLHLEFQLSYMPFARRQGRSNSGCYMQGRYEVQILDSFGLEGKNNECGGLYEIRDPDTNMCFPPLSWQTYDIEYTATKYDSKGSKVANARITVWHNGVLIHKDVELPRATRGHPVKEGADRGPIYIQNHGNPLRFRNIWVVERTAIGPADKEGFVSLFDGKTLSGWHTNPKKLGHGTGGSWYVDEGAITGEQDPPGSGNGGILLTDEKFGDFDLLIDMKPDWGVCSGLFLRSNDRGQCIQMMVDYHDKGNVGHIYGEGTGGFNTRPFDVFGIYHDQKELTGLKTEPTSADPPKTETITGSDWLKVWKVGDWNTARVRVEGNPAKVTTWLNGVKVNVFDGTKFKHERYDRQKVSELLGPAGSIAVQVHGGKSWPNGAKCRWRRIKVKRLD